MELKMAFHAKTGRRIVEVFDNTGRFVAGIYPDETTNGIKVVSKHIATFDVNDGQQFVPAVPDITISFLRDYDEEG